MGNASSSASTTTPPTGDQVDIVAAAVEKAFREQAASSCSEENVDQDLLLVKVRAKLQEKFPSALGGPCIQPDISACIGKTDLVRINKIGNDDKTQRVAEVVAKVEFTNPGLSVKDRIALSMLQDAEKNGKVKPGKTVIVDVTSGNTGIAWGLVCAARGYKTIQIIPEPYSVERRALMMALGVEVIVTEKAAGIQGAMKKYVQVLDSYGNGDDDDDGGCCWSPRQFDNPANLEAHYTGTGPEIWEQCGGKIDVMVAGYGTGGTLSGTTRYLREKNPNFIAIAVEPMEQSLLNGDAPCPHGIQGIVPPFIPDNCKVELIDEVVRCPTAQAMKTSRELAQKEGIACGISAGANVWAACQVAQRPEMKGKRIVTVLPSAAERYFSTPLYQDLIEKATNIPLADIDESVSYEGKINLNLLQNLKEAGAQFRPGFHVT